ncbi:protein goliath precursor, putative [Pediculus humanus corporis]|uniref:Protein goliath, putative n=1 Tax=Pediculus humanus subsp. corporis TaxID=121224 RepID=E0VV19_PEDHC|nr:protein goliath precursor, putative [Pediculus humanus corporis]EEB17225.1 protein goliath precursor, putative [Pediculus humanus corporis]
MSFIFFLYPPSSARCISGIEWQDSKNGDSQDVGAYSYTTAYINVTYLDPVTNKIKSEKSEIGKFGDGKVSSVSGLLIHVSSSEGEYTGCASPLRSSSGDGSLPQEPWIALVKRGQCNFEVKVDNAFKHNASAVLVYNDRESATLDKMKLTGTRNMSAVFTYKWKGEQLAKLVDNGSRVIIYITVATHCTRPIVHSNRTSVLFVSISFVVLTLTSVAWLLFYYVQRFRYLHAKDRISKRLCNAAKKALTKIPTKKIQQEDEEVQGDGECCAVCIEPYRVTEDLRILPCRHEFHKICIDPWLMEHRTCPMCKMNILKYSLSNSKENRCNINSDENAAQMVQTFYILGFKL